MADNLFTVDLKSLDQDIKNPTVGAGSANGSGMRIIFSQEANAAFSDQTQVYLKWTHQQSGIQGYDAFRRIGGPGFPPPPPFHPYPGYMPPPNYYPAPTAKPVPRDANAWEIKWPSKMLREGDVTCTIELVDSISIYSTNSFIVHVIASPHDGEHWIDDDDFTIFQEAVIALNRTMKDAQHMMRRMREEFSNFEREIDNATDIANGAKSKVLDVENRLKTHIELSDAEHEQIKQDIIELQETTTNLTERLATLGDQISSVQNQHTQDVETLQTNIQTLTEQTNNAITELSNQVSENKTELEEKITANSESISTIESTVTELGETVQHISDIPEELENKVVILEASIAEEVAKNEVQAQKIQELEQTIEEKHTIEEYI